MNKPILAAAAVVLAAASFLSASSAVQDPAPGLTNIAYSESLLPHIGKSFYLSPDWTVATEKARTVAAPDGARVFKLVGVARDFAWFHDERVQISTPLTTLRVVTRL